MKLEDVFVWFLIQGMSESKTFCPITDVKKRCWENLHFVNGRICILLGCQTQCTDWLAGRLPRD